MWQDYLFTLVSVVFIIGLVPALRSRTSKPPVSTSLITGGTMLLVAVGDGSLGLYVATISVTINALQWFVLAWQKGFLHV